MKIKKAILHMDSGKEFTLTETALDEFFKLLKEKEAKIQDHPPMIFNDEDGVTKDVIFPNHISHVHFE